VYPLPLSGNIGTIREFGEVGINLKIEGAIKGGKERAYRVKEGGGGGGRVGEEIEREREGWGGEHDLASMHALSIPTIFTNLLMHKVGIILGCGQVM
jgi:hypothetical protein